MQGLYWVVEGSLAGCPRPGGFRSGRPGPAEDPDPARLAADLERLRTQGIGALISLTESPLPAQAIEAAGIITLHLPVDDMQAPTPDQLMGALAFIDRERCEGHAVAVHCKVGQGRTGTILAAYLIRAGMSTEDAIAELRRLSPGAISSPVQVQALETFERQRSWIL